MERQALTSLYPVLSGLPDAALAPLLAQVPLVVPAGTLLFSEQQPCQGFPLILEGSVKVVKSAPSGREILLYRVEPGGSCIITSSCLLGHRPYSARGVAETELRLLPVSAGLFQQWLESHGPFREFVFHLFADRLTELMTLVEEVAFTRLDQRLAKLLLGKGGAVIHTTHQQLAEELGSVREIVTRLLKGLAAQGLVSLGREQITLRDGAGLEALASGNR